MVFAERRGRDRLKVVAEILEIARDGALKTPIMYRANLSFKQLSDYLRFMLRINLLKKVALNGKEVYTATDKGLEFLQRYEEITNLIRRDLVDEEEHEDVSIEIKSRSRPKKQEKMTR